MKLWLKICLNQKHQHSEESGSEEEEPQPEEPESEKEDMEVDEDVVEEEEAAPATVQGPPGQKQRRKQTKPAKTVQADGKRAAASTLARAVRSRQDEIMDGTAAMVEQLRMATEQIGRLQAQAEEAEERAKNSSR